MAANDSFTVNVTLIKRRAGEADVVYRIENMKPTDTIGNLKKRIEDQCKIFGYRQGIKKTQNGYHLGEMETLNSSGITQQDPHALMNIYDAHSVKVTVKNFNGSTIGAIIDIDPHHTVATLKEDSGIIAGVLLKGDGTLLDDARTLIEYSITDGNDVDLFRKTTI